MTGIAERHTHRLRWKTLEAVRHQHVCEECGAEPIVSLDDDHQPVLACRVHGSESVKEIA